jgi:hypothetical protein
MDAQVEKISEGREKDAEGRAVKVAQCGTRSMYAKGCRCEPCVQANSRYLRDYLERRRNAPEVAEHGKVSSYALGCRCPECRLAKKVHQTMWQAAQDTIKAAQRSNAKLHGTRSTYVHGCRCEPCKEANRVYCRAYAGVKIPRGPKRTRKCGTRYSYQIGCRCEECHEANRMYWVRRRIRIKAAKAQQEYSEVAKRPSTGF